MSVYDKIKAFLDQSYKDKHIWLEKQIQDYAHHHPNLSTDELDNLQTQWCSLIEGAHSIEIQTLQEGRFWIHKEKEPPFIELLKAPVPLWSVLFIITLILIIF